MKWKKVIKENEEKARKTAIISVRAQMVSLEIPSRKATAKDKCAESEAFSHRGMTGLPWVIFHSFELLVFGTGE